MGNSASRLIPPPKLHVAILLDGNGRWASARGLGRSEGHRAGVAAVRRIVRTAPSCGIGTLTLYAVSANNWDRPPAEVSALESTGEALITKPVPAAVSTSLTAWQPLVAQSLLPTGMWLAAPGVPTAPGI